MKFKSKTIIVLEMDEAEMEVVLASVDIAGERKGAETPVRLRDRARSFIDEYERAASEFFNKGERTHQLS